jgi:hypothetical protein
MRPFLAFALLALWTHAASAKVVDSRDSGFTVENTVVVPVDTTTAWNALVDDVDRWWPKDHSWFGKDGKFTIDPVAGGCFCERAGARQALHMTISFVAPGEHLRMLGGLGPLQGMGLGGALDWEFAKVPEGTRITLRYIAGGYTTQDLKKFVVIVDQVQGIQLGGLAKYLSPKP